jgi:hypothetical protein
MPYPPDDRATYLEPYGVDSKQSNKEEKQKVCLYTCLNAYTESDPSDERWRPGHRARTIPDLDRLGCYIRAPTSEDVDMVVVKGGSSDYEAVRVECGCCNRGRTVAEET